MLTRFCPENQEFTTKSGKKGGSNRWTIGSVHTLLTNRSYIGEREVNKRFRTSDPNKIKEDERYFFVEAQWPALISKELFFDVQRLLEQNKTKARKYVHEYRLTGLIECAECGAKLIGKSGSGKSQKYFYYGHKRKMIVGNDRHLERCKIENVPALQIEEALISRLKDLSSDRDLIAELVKSTLSGKRESLEHEKAVIAVKEQERRKLDQKLKNLYDTISEEDNRDLRAGLPEKAKETKRSLDQTELVIVDLKREYQASNNVVDISGAMEVVRVFREKAFDAQPVAPQSEILKSRVRRIVIRENGVHVEILGRFPERSVLLSQSPDKKIPTAIPLAGSRSGVLTVSKLVEATGIEPATF